jgi:hypothetical protein
MAIFRAFVKPDLANVQDVGAYDPCEKFTAVEVVDNPREIAVEFRRILETDSKFAAIVLTDTVDPVIVETPSDPVVTVLTDTVEPVIVETPNAPATIVLTDTVEPTRVDKPIPETLTVLVVSVDPLSVETLSPVADPSVLVHDVTPLEEMVWM